MTDPSPTPATIRIDPTVGDFRSETTLQVGWGGRVLATKEWRGTQGPDMKQMAKWVDEKAHNPIAYPYKQRPDDGVTEAKEEAKEGLSRCVQCPHIVSTKFWKNKSWKGIMKKPVLIIPEHQNAWVVHIGEDREISTHQNKRDALNAAGQLVTEENRPAYSRWKTTGAYASTTTNMDFFKEMLLPSGTTYRSTRSREEKTV